MLYQAGEPVDKESERELHKELYWPGYRERKDREAAEDYRRNVERVRREKK